LNGLRQIFVNKTYAYGDEIDLEVQRSSPCFVYWV